MLLILSFFYSSASVANDLDSLIAEDIIEFTEGYDKRIRFAPRTVVAMTHEQIAISGALNLGELLERVVGVHISRNDSGYRADKYVRGVQENWIVLHNGIEIERTLPDLYALPVADIERLEVLKGSHFAIYGPAAIVGTVNIVTFTPQENETTVSTRGGTLGTSEAWVRKSTELVNGGYSLFFYHSNTDGSRDSITSDRQTELDLALGDSASLAPSRGYFDRRLTDVRLTFELGERWSFNQYFSDRQAGLGIGIAQAIDPSGQENLTRSATNLRYSRQLDNGSLDAQVAYNYEVATYEDTMFFPPGTLGGLFPEGVSQSYGQTGQEITANAIRRFAINRHSVEVGIGLRYGTATNDFDRRNYFIQNGSPLPVPVGSTQEFTDNDALFDKDYDNFGSHILIRDQFLLTGDLKLDAGLRIDNDERYGTVTNPRIGLEYALAQYTNLTFLYGESSILPTVIQQTSNGIFTPLGNNDLTASKMRMFEVAIDHRFSPSTKLLINTFVYRQSAGIKAVPDEESPNGSSFANLDKNDEGSGFELTIDWGPNPQLSLKAGLAFQHKFNSNSDSERAPSWLPSLEATYRSPSRWESNFSLFGVYGRSRELGDSRDEIGDYTIANISFRYHALENAPTLTLDVQNVFDATAKEDVSSSIADDLPVWPQRILIGVRANF
ncbi:TonB-dependent receptor [Maritalea sp.]|uniref:TonB-dependent receptor n=1 Tax=Maritalea sp. TaxID=2003361 RepID=UPI003EF58EFA